MGGCSGSLLLRLSGLRATPELWQCPGRLPGREQGSCCYVRGRTCIHREAAGSVKGMAGVLRPLSGDPMGDGLGEPERRMRKLLRSSALPFHCFHQAPGLKTVGAAGT